MSALILKELRSLFRSPIAYIVVAVFLAVLGYTFSSVLYLTRVPTFVHTVFQSANLLLVVVPILTMRSFAEERRSATFELLITAPVPSYQLVLAKFVGAYITVAALIGTTVVFPLTLAWLGAPDWGPILSGYLGLLGLSSVLVAIGICASAATTHQAIAAVSAIGVSLLLWMAGTLAVLLPDPFDHLPLALSLHGHLRPFATGLIYLSDLGFFVLATMIALVLAHRLLGRRP
ncbi:MAG: ABC transporter permease [Pseudomonadota bacterium]